MNPDDTPLWAQELRQFTEFSFVNLERRLTHKIDGVVQRLDVVEQRLDGIDGRLNAFEDRVTRKIEKMDLRIGERFERLEGDVAELKAKRD